MFDLYYKKNDNSALFESFNNIGIYNVQNYIPLYKQFFSLKESNYKNLNLNHHFHIIKVEPTNKRNKFNCIILTYLLLNFLAECAIFQEQLLQFDSHNLRKTVLILLKVTLLTDKYSFFFLSL